MFETDNKAEKKTAKKNMYVSDESSSKSDHFFTYDETDGPEGESENDCWNHDVRV